MEPDLKLNIEPDSFIHLDMGRIDAEDEAFAIHEVRMSDRSVVRELIETLVLTLLIFLAVRGVVQNFMVEGSSMEPTLRDQQYLLVNKIAYTHWDARSLSRLNPLQTTDSAPTGTSYLLGGPQRGDIVVFQAPQDTRDFIKRVIGLPGETVKVMANQGVYINGARLTEPYVADLANYNWPEEGASGVIPPGQIFVLGDNRQNSEDSHKFGPIGLERVVGMTWFCYWPPGKIGPLAHPIYDAIPAATPVP